MADFRKKISCRLISSGKKNLARKYKALRVGEKYSITRGLEEINLSYTNQITNKLQYLSFPLQKSNGWPLSNGT